MTVRVMKHEQKEPIIYHELEHIMKNSLLPAHQHIKAIIAH